MQTMLILGHLVVHARALAGKAIKCLNTNVVCLLVCYVPMCHKAVFCLWCKEIVNFWNGILDLLIHSRLNLFTLQFGFLLSIYVEFAGDYAFIPMSAFIKCDNRLFHIKLEIPKFSRYHFLKAFSHPIRCISRCRNPRTTMTWKRPTSAPDPSNESQSFGLCIGSLELQHNSIHEIRAGPSSKWIKLGKERTSTMGQTDVACYSDTWTTNQVANAVETQLARGAENIEEADNSPSVSDSIEERLSDFNIMSSSGYLISDVIIFKYCLGGLTDRTLLLKEVATSASEEDLLRLANEVSLYSGCSHHRRQIVIPKRLIEEGTKVWNSISQNNRLIQWENGVFEIEEQFMRITCSSTRSFTEQDFELLRRISGCGEYMAQEKFEKIWRWLYPVAFTLTSDSINTVSIHISSH